MSDELLPCPFCGGRAQVYGNITEWWVECDDCKTGSPPIFKCQRRDEAVTKWNVRSPRAIDAQLRDAVNGDREACASASNRTTTTVAPGGDMWIPVTDRLPENDTTTLLYSPGAAMPFAVADYTECQFDDGQHYWWFDHDADGVFAPTHWMELPEPPNAKLSGTETEPTTKREALLFVTLDRDVEREKSHGGPTGPESHF